MSKKTLKFIFLLSVFTLISSSFFAFSDEPEERVSITVDLDFGTIRIGNPPPAPPKAPPPPKAHNPPPPPHPKPPKHIKPPKPGRCPPPPPPRRLRHRKTTRRVVVDPTKPLPPSTHFYPDMYGDTDKNTEDKNTEIEKNIQ